MHWNPCQTNAQAFLTARCRAGTACSGRSHSSEDFPFLSAPSPGSDVTNMAEAGCDSLSFTSRWRGWKDRSQTGFLTDSSPRQFQADSVRIQLSHPRDMCTETEKGAWCYYPWLIMRSGEDTQRPHLITSTSTAWQNILYTIKACPWVGLNPPLLLPEPCLPVSLLSCQFTWNLSVDFALETPGTNTHVLLMVR